VCDEQVVSSVTLQAIYRDFKTDHVDFAWEETENDAGSQCTTFPSASDPVAAPTGCDICTGARGQTCGDRPIWYKPDVTTGMLASTLDANGKPQCIAELNMLQSCSTFNSQWYQDVPGVNIRIEGDLTLTEDTNTGRKVFESDAFFPLDNQGWADPSLASPDNQCNVYVAYGLSLDSSQCPIGTVPVAALRNYFFTTEIHTTFTYFGSEVFQFEGDDDVWVFIDGKLEVDVGGVHQKQARSINLDSVSPALVAGNTYPLDIFHAERQVTDSNFKLETSITVTTCPPGTVRSCWPNCTSTSSIAEQPRQSVSATSASVGGAGSGGGDGSGVAFGAIATFIAFGLYKRRRLPQQYAAASVAPTEPAVAATSVDGVVQLHSSKDGGAAADDHDESESLIDEGAPDDVSAFPGSTVHT